MQLLKLFLGPALLLAFALPASADLSPALRENIEKRIEAGRNVGFIIGIIDAEGPRYYGFGRVGKNSDEVPNKDTVYEIGSIGKTFTATLLADMVVKGEVKLEDPAQTFLPESVTMPSHHYQAVTLEDLATHRSGLPRMPTNFDPADPLNPFADYEVNDLYEFLNNHELERAPGGERLYSNVGFGLLGHLLSLEAGMDYETLVATRIAGPLGMESTGIKLDTSMQHRLAPPYAYRDGELVPVKNWDVRTLEGAGALRSSAADMLRYLAAELGLASSPLDEAIALTQQVRGEFPGIGLGWSVSGTEENKIYAHNGGTGGYRTFTGFSVADKRGVIVMTNSTDSPDDVGIHLMVEDYPLKEF